MNIRLLTAVEAIRLLRRGPIKYARGVSGLYLLSTKNRNLARMIRTSFFFFRNIDDALDGDRKDIKDPLKHVLECRQQIASGKYTGKPKIVSLAKFAMDRLQKNANSKDNLIKSFLDELDIILFDYQRTEKRKILSKNELKNYYQNTFFPVLDITLIALNSNLRAKDIPELSFCQGRVYTVRDLKTDWNRGLINIPKEILKRAGLTANSSFHEVKTSKIVNKWFYNELEKCQQDLSILDQKLTNSSEKLTAKFCGVLASPLKKLSKQYLAKLSSH